MFVEPIDGIAGPTDAAETEHVNQHLEGSEAFWRKLTAKRENVMAAPEAEADDKESNQVQSKVSRHDCRTSEPYSAVIRFSGCNTPPRLTRAINADFPTFSSSGVRRANRSELLQELEETDPYEIIRIASCPQIPSVPDRDNVVPYTQRNP